MCANLPSTREQRDSFDLVFNHQQNQTVNNMFAGGGGGAPPNEALLHTSGNVPACIRLGPQRGQLGDTFIIMFISISSGAIPGVSDTARAGPTPSRIIPITNFHAIRDVWHAWNKILISFSLSSSSTSSCFITRYNILPFFSLDLFSSAESVSVIQRGS